MDVLESEDKIWEAFEELVPKKTFVTTRSGNKTGDSSQEDRKTAVTPLKEQTKQPAVEKTKQTNVDKAYTYESKVADSEAPRKLYNTAAQFREKRCKFQCEDLKTDVRCGIGSFMDFQVGELSCEIVELFVP